MSEPNHERAAEAALRRFDTCTCLAINITEGEVEMCIWCYDTMVNTLKGIAGRATGPGDEPDPPEHIADWGDV